MNEKLIRIFIKDYQNTNDPKVRSAYGTFAGIIGILCNVLLTIVKIIIGLMSGAVSVLSDSFNNMSDAISSIVTLFGFRLSGKDKDFEHPYGHGRIEYLAGLSVSVLIIAIGLNLLWTSVKAIFHPGRMDVDMTTVIILIISILVKVWMSYFYSDIAGRIDSPALEASAADSRNDCITTGVSLISVLVMLLWKINIDPYAGAIVSLFVIRSGLSAAYDTLSPLLGSSPDPELINKLKDIVMSHEEIQGIHDIRIHEYGPGEKIGSMHVEVAAELGIVRAHELVDDIERDIEEADLVNEMTIHIDPIISGDAELDHLAKWTEDKLKELDEDIHMHDFRLIHDKRQTRVLFDLELPYSFDKSEEEVISYIGEEYHKAYPQYRMTVSAIDRR